MKYQVFALLPVLGSAIAQGVTEKISPTAPAPAGCTGSLDGDFQIIIVDPKAKVKRDFAHQKRGFCHLTGEFIGKLDDGVLIDDHGRTGYIASNYQLQFDDPPQAGALITAGFTHCPNGTLALGNSTIFWQCKSGDFYNIYDRYWAEQCTPMQILARECDGQGDDSDGLDDHIVGTEIYTTTIVVPLGDGQPQVITTTIPVPVCEIDDGQLQGHTTPCAAIAGVPHEDLTLAPVNQLSDGQIQVTPIGSPPPAPSVPAQTTQSVPPFPPDSIVPNTTVPHTTAPPTHSGPEKTPAAPSTGNAERGVKMSSIVALVVGFVAVISVL